MAIKQETITEAGTDYLYTYSDAGMLIEQNETGQVYQDAMDLVPCAYTYTETEIPIEQEDEDALYAAAGRLMLGVD